MEKNSNISNIVTIQKDGVSPATYAQIQNCQPTSASVERSFSMLGKLLRKDTISTRKCRKVPVIVLQQTLNRAETSIMLILR